MDGWLADGRIINLVNALLSAINYITVENELAG